jgi:tetratricopeptide (TPR) repeat protein
LACRSRAEATRARLAGLLASIGLAAATGAAPAPGVAPAAADPEDRSPLVALVATLDTATPPAQARHLTELRSAEAALARTPGPDRDCAQALGAARHGSLRANLAQARQALGDRQGAIEAWQRAIDCEPRNASHRVALGGLLLTFARLDEARAQAERAAALAPRQPGLEALQARLAYVAGQWPEAATRARRLATRLQDTTVPAGADDAVVDADAEPATVPPVLARSRGAAAGSEIAAFWRLQALLARRRGGLPWRDLPGPDPALEDRWPVPLWRFATGEVDERGVAAAIAAQPEPRQRREMACEALFYTAQLAFANGRPDEGRRRLARVVNLKVLYYVEHDMALAELATLRSP